MMKTFKSLILGLFVVVISCGEKEAKKEKEGFQVQRKKATEKV